MGQQIFLVDGTFTPVVNGPHTIKLRGKGQVGGPSFMGPDVGGAGADWVVKVATLSTSNSYDMFVGFFSAGGDTFFQLSAVDIARAIGGGSVNASVGDTINAGGPGGAAGAGGGGGGGGSGSELGPGSAGAAGGVLLGGAGGAGGSTPDGDGGAGGNVGGNGTNGADDGGGGGGPGNGIPGTGGRAWAEITWTDASGDMMLLLLEC